jgi:hypothetical protein
MLNQQRIGNEYSIVNQQRSLTMEYPLLIYTFSNRISAMDNLLLNKLATDNLLLKIKIYYLHLKLFVVNFVTEFYQQQILILFTLD